MILQLSHVHISHGVKPSQAMETIALPRTVAASIPPICTVKKTFLSLSVLDTGHRYVSQYCPTTPIRYTLLPSLELWAQNQLARCDYVVQTLISAYGDNLASF